MVIHKIGKYPRGVSGETPPRNISEEGSFSLLYSTEVLNLSEKQINALKRSSG